VKKWILVLLFLSSACVHRSEEIPESGGEEAPEVKPVEVRCAELKKMIVTSTEKSRAEFFNEVLVAMETEGDECSPKAAAIYLDSVFEIHCDELCRVREK